MRPSSLLYGRRHPRKLSPERKKRQAQAAQLLEEKIVCDRYREQSLLVRDAIVTGDGKPLQYFLEDKVNQATSNMRDQFLEEIVGELYRHSLRGTEPLEDEQSLAALVLLSDCCQRRPNLDEESWIVCHRYAATMASQHLFEKLQTIADEIGPLPAVAYDYQHKGHIVSAPGGAAICGTTVRSGYASFNYETLTFIHSAATAKVECNRCLTFYKRDNQKGTRISSEDWTKMFGNLKYGYWGDCFDLGFGGMLDGDSPCERAAVMIDYYYQEAKQRCQEMIACVSDYHLSDNKL